MATPIEQLQQQLAHQKRTIDMVHQQQIQNRTGGRRKREELEQWMHCQVEAMQATLTEVTTAMDLLAPGTSDDDIASLTATFSTLVQSVQGMKKESMDTFAELDQKIDHDRAMVDSRIETLERKQQIILDGASMDTRKKAADSE